MNFKNRLEKIEKEISFGKNEIYFDELLSPNYIHTGKCYDSWDTMIKEMNIVEIHPEVNSEEILCLVEKGIIGPDCKITTNGMDRRALRGRVYEEMQKRM